MRLPFSLLSNEEIQTVERIAKIIYMRFANQLSGHNLSSQIVENVFAEWRSSKEILPFIGIAIDAATEIYLEEFKRTL